MSQPVHTTPSPSPSPSSSPSPEVGNLPQQSPTSTQGAIQTPVTTGGIGWGPLFVDPGVRVVNHSPPFRRTYSNDSLGSAYERANAREYHELKDTVKTTAEVVKILQQDLAKSIDVTKTELAQGLIDTKKELIELKKALDSSKQGIPTYVTIISIVVAWFLGQVVLLGWK
ncbi:hypothetical protein K474DRAFT_1708735 [Panus rudis PR-1116 ss-1]|nr:hypothetical protein K474DRAFT_1708735 [Panus rudis PR-1116 ss-1]